MAAIFGAVGEVGDEILETMGEALSHRGPRAKIARISDTAALGIRRRGREPSLADDGRYVAASDASVFNAAELGAALSLQPDDSAFADELFLRLYVAEGPSGIDKVNGDFAFVLWDRHTRRLTLARDYVGSRPLYFTSLSDGTLLFASEYKAFLRVEGFRPEPDLDMIQHLQHCKHLPDGRTLLKNVNSVPAASFLTFDFKEGTTRMEKLPPIELDVRYLSEEEWIRRIRETFLDAVRVRLVGQGRVGVALSGGIDSAAVACACREIDPEGRIHTFTAGYGADDPEVINASKVADAMNTFHHEIITTPHMVERSLRALVWHMENPIARSETLQLYEIAHKASEFVESVLTGMASDGLFAGMPKHKLVWLSKKAPFLKRAFEEFYTLTQTGRRPKTLFGKLAQALYFRGRLTDVPKIAGTDYQPPVTVFPKGRKELVNSVLAGGFQAGVPTWLPKVERTFAAWDVRFSSPFLDKRMIRLGFQIPDAFKIRKGQEKYILRRALRSIVPEELLNVPKAPQRMKNDLAFSNTLDEIAEKTLTRERVEKHGFFDYDELCALRKRNKNRPYIFESAMRIWTAVLTEIWAEEFLDRQSVPA